MVNTLLKALLLLDTNKTDETVWREMIEYTMVAGIFFVFIIN